MKVHISLTAKNSLEKIIYFLKERWTEREINWLRNDIKAFIQSMDDGIVKHQFLENFPHIQFVLIGNKQVKIFYEIRNNIVLIKLFLALQTKSTKSKTIVKIIQVKLYASLFL